MAIFGVLNSTSITNVIVADTLEIAEMVTEHNCVEIPEGVQAGIGWTFVDGDFIAPEAPAADSESVV